MNEERYSDFIARNALVRNYAVTVTGRSFSVAGCSTLLDLSRCHGVSLPVLIKLQPCFCMTGTRFE